MKKKHSILDVFHASDGIHIRTELSSLRSKRKILRSLRKLQKQYPNQTIQAITGSMPGPDDDDILLADCLQLLGGICEALPYDNRFVLWTLALKKH